MRLESLKSGDCVYDVCRGKMGNTEVKTIMIYVVKVVEVDLEKRRAFVSWNGNTPRWVSETKVKKYKKKRPELEFGLFGQARLKKKIKCKNCGKEEGFHKAKTKNCPMGRRTRIGYTMYAETIYSVV